MESLEYNLVLPEFEGPLDLLLHLVKKHELDIFNIPISFITAQYIRALDQMRALNMDVAGEYLLMAATLTYIKSRELVPHGPEEEEVVDPELEEFGDPREALVKRLLEYQKFKAAAQYLAGRPVVGRNVWGRGQTPESLGDSFGEAPLADVPVWELIELLAMVLGRTRRKLTHEVTIERLSLVDRINELNERLEREPRVEFTVVLQRLAEKAEQTAPGTFFAQVVLTFMAVLEMAKLRLVQIVQTEEMGAIYLSRAPGAGPVIPRLPGIPEDPEPPADADVADHVQPPDAAPETAPEPVSEPVSENDPS